MAFVWYISSGKCIQLNTSPELSFFCCAQHHANTICRFGFFVFWVIYDIDQFLQFKIILTEIVVPATDSTFVENCVWRL